jgi:predicted GNAT family acetyltransferase
LSVWRLSKGVTIKIQSGLPGAIDLERIRSFLEQDEAANNLPLGLLPRVAEQRGPAEQERRPFFGFVEHDGQIVFVMMMTPPHNMIVYGAGGHLEAAIEAAAAFLLGNGIDLPGVIGSRDVATSFASTWRQHTDCTLQVQMEQMIYRLDRVNDIALSPGKLICATAVHTHLIADWVVSFSKVTHDPLDRVDALARAQEMIDASRVYLWIDQEPVSMAWRARPTRHGIVVSGVYTPPGYRCQGYATACVASLSRLLLDEGYEFCALYADLANPVSNHIYQKMGYRPIQASIVYGFEF